MIPRMLSLESGVKKIVSSIRFRNSGLKVAFRTPSTAVRVSSSIVSPCVSSKNCEPILLVIIITVFLKSTTRPLESVKRPSSNTCNKILNTSGCAFSISSKRTIVYGLRRTASVNWPPSSYPTYPGGAPTKRDTECFSIYSLMSIRTIWSSESNKSSARAFASSVLPTPVGPRNKKLPIGRLGFCNPARERRTAEATFCTASS